MGTPDPAVAELKRAVKLLKTADEYGLDLETTGFNPQQDAIKGISLSVGLSDDTTWWFPFRGVGALSQVQTLRELAPIFADPQKTWVGSNVKFDLKFLMKNGATDIRNSFADTVVAQWLVDEESRRGLKQLAKKYLGVEMVGYKEAAAMEGGLFPHIFADYAKDDARYVLELWKRLKVELHDQKLTKLFHEIEMQITMALTEMELTGIAIDKNYLKEFEAKMTAQRDEAREKAFSLAGKKFKIDSPKEVAALLFDDMRLKPLPGMQKGKSGHYSVNEDTLTRYDEPIIKALLSHRTAAHNLKTYCTPYKARLKDIDRIYAEFKQAGTVAGRFTSNNPNLQQISKDIKPIFVAGPGMKLVCGDFNQLQFRLVGHFAKRVLGKSKVADAYLEGLDLHTKTQEELKFTDRRDAKIVNFAFLFGRGWKAFMEAQRTDEKTAKAYYNGFHKAYPEVRRMAEWCRRRICKEGFVSSIAGRRRHFAHMIGQDPQAKDSYWPGWVAWNAVIQGAESDLVRVSMRNVQRTIEVNRKKDKRWHDVHLLVQVHDEIMAEAPEELAQDVSDMLVREAESAMTLEVPILFECGIGDSWNQAKP
jgi:DNA polymerase-1